MDENEIKYVVEAALLAAGRPLSLDKLVQLFTDKGVDMDRAAVRAALDALAGDYAGRGLQVKEVASGYRIQVKSSMQDWLQPLWEERAPRYTRALLETLALVAYRQPITRAEIEEVRGVVVSSNIVRTLMERGWVRVVGYRDVPGKPSMLGTTREFLDYFGLKKLEDLPPLADIKDGFPELSPQGDFLESLDAIDIDTGDAQVVAPIAVAEDAAAGDPDVVVSEEGVEEAASSAATDESALAAEVDGTSDADEIGNPADAEQGSKAADAGEAGGAEDLDAGADAANGATPAPTEETESPSETVATRDDLESVLPRTQSESS